MESSVTDVKGVGEEVGKKLKKLGIETVEQLILNFPRRYDDYSHISSIAHIKPGIVTIKAEIKQAKGRYVRRGMHITEAVASDESSSVRLVWFNQPYRAAALKPGTEYYISGLFELRAGRLSIMNPSAELVSEFPVNTARIVPVYRETKGLKSGQIRKALKAAFEVLPEMSETLPKWLIKQENLMPKGTAIKSMHFPLSSEDLETAKRRLGFEEIFELSLASLLNKQEIAANKALQIPFKEALAKEFVGHLPYKLTDAQRKVIWQIYLDLQKDQPMNRLVEGDVGSGKTVVAAMAALMAMEQNYQVALMAPTELLARQHAETIYNFLKPLGYEDQIGLLIGSIKPKAKEEVRQRIKAGAVRFIIGTHALIQDSVDMHRLGLVIIDEQHRFGVEQRKKLQAKAGHLPHILSLTATPIPRSLALTLYGEMDVSIIGDKPPGRKPIITKIVSPNSRPQLNDKLQAVLDKKQQIFIVCPQISPSDIMPGETSVEEVYERVKKTFKSHSVGLLHGKMKVEDKAKIMEDFVSGKTDILVATTVVEVGVDVPNANAMVIESAERFGLAQAHQLRGRVGRSDEQGYCFLVMTGSSAPTRRLRALETSSDGFALAEMDLEIRGPGAIYGVMQHGQLDLRVASLTDVRLIAAARSAAQKFIDKKDDLLEYKELAERVNRLRAVTNLN